MRAFNLFLKFVVFGSLIGCTDTGRPQSDRATPEEIEAMGLVQGDDGVWRYPDHDDHGQPYGESEDDA